MKNTLRLILLGIVIVGISCAGPPKHKLDRLYHGLQEALPHFDTSILSGRVILLDPGHGGFFRGTEGPDSLDEASVNLGVALYLGGLLMEAGANVHFTRSADRDFLAPEDSSLAFDLGHRTALIDSIRPDIFVSIHHNAQNARDPDKNAIETYYRYDDPASRDLAFAVHRHLMRNLGIEIGEVRQGNYFVLRAAKVPAILGEASYLTNPKVEDKLRLSEKQKLEAEAYFLGILDYFHRGLPKITFIAPEETTLTHVPEIIFKANDSGGIGIDPDAVFMNINNREVRAVFDDLNNQILYRMPWNAPNRPYNVLLQVRNLMGNSSSIVGSSFKIDFPPENAVFQIFPENPPENWGTVRIKVMLLDRRGLQIGDGAKALINIGRAAAGRHIETQVKDGYIEFHLSPNSDQKNITINVESRGREFSHTFKRAAADITKPSRPFIKKIVIDSSNGSPIKDAWVQLEDSLLIMGSRSGVCMMPSSADSSKAVFKASGYIPQSWFGSSSDTVYMDPWFGGAIRGKRFILDPQGGSAKAVGIGKLGLPASHVNLQVAQYLASYLRLAGAEVVLTRESEEMRLPQDIVGLANSFRADRYVEIRHHCTPAPSSTTDPLCVKTYFFPGSNSGKALAEAVARGFTHVCEIPTSSVGEQVTYPLQQTACPAIVIDAPSVSIVEEELKLGEPWYLRLQAYAIFVGILEHFHVTDQGELIVNIDAPGDEANWLLTLDNTWNLLASPEGKARFSAVADGSHTITARKNSNTVSKPIILSGETSREITFHPAGSNP